jgi:UDP:flavonoid glycosyltransferase YjiC (YdhE family)
MASTPRILFVGEAVTLAHVARPAALAGGLDRDRLSVTLACSRDAQRFLGEDERFRRVAIRSLSPALFRERLRRGVPVFTADELALQVKDDLALIAAERPDMIVGDFRLSLSISARVARVPYATISNAYWSPYAMDTRWPLPVLPWTRWAPIGLAEQVFNAVAGPILSRHAQPLNVVRRLHGLSELPPELRAVYTDADDTLYADAPALFPMRTLPPSHRFLGPLLWSVPQPLPPWWPELPERASLAYLTMGSSGDPSALGVLLRGLQRAGLSAVVSTAGAPPPVAPAARFWSAPYLPGEAAAARCALVVCNGGSPTAQQALAAGRPVLGICDNMDQFLNMRALARSGLGLGLRADRLSADAVASAVGELLQRAIADQDWAAVQQPDAHAQFARFLAERLGTAPGPIATGQSQRGAANPLGLHG